MEDLICHRLGDGALVSFAELDGRLHQRLKHSLQIERGAADHLEHVGGCGLLLQRLLQVLGPRLDLVEQACILNCNHRLVREGLRKLNLFLGEGSDRFAAECHDADRVPLPQQRYAEECPVPGFPGWFEISVFGVCEDIGDLHGLALLKDAAHHAAAPCLHADALVEFDPIRRITTICHVAITRAVVARYPRHVGLAQVRGGFGQRIKHCLQVEGGAADDLEHLGSGGLLLQRFPQLVEQPRVLDGNHGLGGKVCQ